MADSDYYIRNYQPVDFERLVRFCLEAGQLEPGGRPVSREAIGELMCRPGYTPARDLFVAQKDEDLVGDVDLTPELRIGRVILYGWVHPEHRRRGLATGLVECAMLRSKELGARVAHVQIGENNVAARILLTKLGFKFVRRHLEVKLDLARLHLQSTGAETPDCCPLARGDEDKLALIQNRSFAGSWGYNPNTLEDILYRTNLKGRSRDGIFLARDGERVAGFCWTEITPENEGRIFMVGVDPEYRGRGVGRKVLMAGLEHLRNRGLCAAGLTVDSQNRTAIELYRSVGFVVHASSRWYEKPVD